MRKAKKVQLMSLYKNLSGASKVARYHIAKDALTIRYADDSVYLYTNQSTSPETISKMKTLATAGKGLSTFLDAGVKDKFSRKIR